MVNRNLYINTKPIFVEYIKKQKKRFKEEHGINLSDADLSGILYKKFIEPNNIQLTDAIKPIDINKKWKKLKLRL